MLRHPADRSQWRKIDRVFKDFAGDARNLRFGLNTDGFNPFGEHAWCGGDDINHRPVENPKRKV
jgi:hypothetical protein